VFKNKQVLVANSLRTHKPSLINNEQNKKENEEEDLKAKSERIMNEEKTKN
jgi:hypothetical protein